MISDKEAKNEIPQVNPAEEMPIESQPSPLGEKLPENEIAEPAKTEENDNTQEGG